MQYSIRTLLVGILLTSLIFPITAFYAPWQRGFVDRQYPDFRAFQQLHSLSDGDELQPVKTRLPQMRAVGRDSAKKVFPNRKLASDDQFFVVSFDGGEALCWLQFRNDLLVNHQISATDPAAVLAAMGVAKPTWLIRFGNWILYTILISAILLFTYIHSRKAKSEACQNYTTFDDQESEGMAGANANWNAE